MDGLIVFFFLTILSVNKVFLLQYSKWPQKNVCFAIVIHDQNPVLKNAAIETMQPLMVALENLLNYVILISFMHLSRKEPREVDQCICIFTRVFFFSPSKHIRLVLMTCGELDDLAGIAFYFSFFILTGWLLLLDFTEKLGLIEIAYCRRLSMCVGDLRAESQRVPVAVATTCKILYVKRR